MKTILKIIGIIIYFYLGTVQALTDEEFDADFENICRVMLTGPSVEQESVSLTAAQTQKCIEWLAALRNEPLQILHLSRLFLSEDNLYRLIDLIRTNEQLMTIYFVHNHFTSQEDLVAFFEALMRLFAGRQIFIYLDESQISWREKLQIEQAFKQLKNPQIRIYFTSVVSVWDAFVRSERQLAEEVREDATTTPEYSEAIQQQRPSVIAELKSYWSKLSLSHTTDDVSQLHYYVAQELYSRATMFFPERLRKYLTAEILGCLLYEDDLLLIWRCFPVLMFFPERGRAFLSELRNEWNKWLCNLVENYQLPLQLEMQLLSARQFCENRDLEQFACLADDLLEPLSDDSLKTLSDEKVEIMRSCYENYCRIVVQIDSANARQLLNYLFCRLFRIKDGSIEDLLHGDIDAVMTLFNGVDLDTVVEEVNRLRRLNGEGKLFPPNVLENFLQLDKFCNQFGIDPTEENKKLLLNGSLSEIRLLFLQQRDDGEIIELVNELRQRANKAHSSVLYPLLYAEPVTVETIIDENVRPDHNSSSDQDGSDLRQRFFALPTTWWSSFSWNY